MLENFKTTKSGYKFNKNIFRLGVGIIILFSILTIIYAYKEDSFYISCPADAIGGKCYNPYYGETDFFQNKLHIKYISLSYQEELYAGQSYGSPLPLWVTDGHIIILLFMALLFFFNHLKHNTRGKK